MNLADDWWFQRRFGDFRRGVRGVRLRWEGGSAQGVLYDEGAPSTAAAIWDVLPLRIPVVHVAWSGEMCMGAESYELGVEEPENAVRLVRPGDLTWDHKFGELCFVYGDAECRLPSGPNTVVVFGSIREGLAELAEFGRARRFHGIADTYLEAV
jgi:hypothetical protein